jgi:hypothetical protein
VPNRLEKRREAAPSALEDKRGDIVGHSARRVVHGMFHGRDSPRTPARRPIASPGPPDAYSPFPSARASPGAALASHHHALSNAIDASWSSGRRSPRRGATHPAREGPSDWSSRAAEMEAMLERKLERADSTRGGDPWRAAATPDALNVARDPAPHVDVDRGESPDELRRRVRELQARLARAERELASDRARRASRETPTGAAHTRTANAELAALTYENERLRRRCAEAEATSARLRSAAALDAASPGRGGFLSALPRYPP